MTPEKSNKTQWDETLSPNPTKCRKSDHLQVRKKQNKKNIKKKKNVYRLKYYWGNVVSYVVKDSWTKHNQFTTDFCCIVTKFIKMRNKCKMKNSDSLCAGQWHTFLRGSTAKAQKSLLDDRRIAKSLPPPSVDPRSSALRDWIVQIPLLELYQQSKGGSVISRLPSLSTTKTVINQARLAWKETLASEGKTQNRRQRFFCLFVRSILASLHYLSSKKR